MHVGLSLVKRFAQFYIAIAFHVEMLLMAIRSADQRRLWFQRNNEYCVKRWLTADQLNGVFRVYPYCFCIQIAPTINYNFMNLRDLYFVLIISVQFRPSTQLDFQAHGIQSNRSLHFCFSCCLFAEKFPTDAMWTYGSREILLGLDSGRMPRRYSLCMASMGRPVTNICDTWKMVSYIWMIDNKRIEFNAQWH